MKRILSAIVILSLILSMPTGAWAGSGPKAPGAEGSNTKEIEVTLSGTPVSVKMGETVDLTATSVKHGSSFTDQWDAAVKASTEFDSETETYVSKAVFQAENPGIYTIRYTIRMTAGNSNTSFGNVVERTIEVINPASIVGAVIRNLNVAPVYRSDGSISAYSASGKTYALWSDDSTTPVGSVFFFFGPNETSKAVRVSFQIDGKTYLYTVAVTR